MVEFVNRYAHAHHPVAADSFADGSERLVQETHAVFETAAVVILAPIGTRIDELGRQIAHGDHVLDTIETGFRHAPGTVAIGFHDVVDEGEGHRRGHDVMAFIGHFRRCPGSQQRPVPPVGDRAAWVEKLAEHAGTMAMRGISHHLQVGNGVVVAHGQQVVTHLVAFVDGVGLGDDETDSSPGAGLVIGDEVRHGPRLAALTGAVGTEDHTIGDFQGAQFDGPQEVGERHRQI